MKRYRVTFEVEVSLAPELLDSVLTDEWRAQMYPFHKPEDVANHVAFNMARGLDLDDIDGYCDQPKERAKCGQLETVDVVEIVEQPKRKGRNSK